VTTGHERGASVLELLVALALTLIVIVAAGQLVAEAVRVFEAAGLKVRSPSLTLAAATLRNHMQETRAVVGPPTIGWTDRPLQLLTSDGSRVQFSLERGALVRQTCDPLWRPTARRVLARGVTEWWWRFVNPHTVDVRLTALVAVGTGEHRRGPVARRTEIRRFAVRGAPGGRSW
jgi:hypothetical protein